LVRKAGNLRGIHNCVQAWMQRIDSLASITGLQLKRGRSQGSCSFHSAGDLEKMPLGVVTVLQRQVCIRRRSCDARMHTVHVRFGLQHLRLHHQHVQEAATQMDTLVYQLAEE
jgi:hypothetical protein